MNQRRKYLTKARTKVMELLVRIDQGGQAAYSELFCEAMAFPLVTPADLDSLIKDIGDAVKLCFAGDIKGKKGSPERRDMVEVTDARLLREHLKNKASPD
jgi:hypothetical protein